METRYTWDPVKAASNLRDHGISFETACEAFDDPNQVTVENYFMEHQGEQRYALIGMTRGLALLLIVFVDRTEPDVEIIHIVSARKAEKYEIKNYTAHFHN